MGGPVILSAKFICTHFWGIGWSLTVNFILACIINAGVSLVVMKWMLVKKRYSDFRIALIERERLIEAL